MVSVLFLVSISMADKKFDLMYRRPGAETHENITEVFDDILKRLEEIESVLSELEPDDNPGLTE